ncbi:MAG: hypothetical protein WCK05_10920, partial [Planctomycetota bacterium]
MRYSDAIIKCQGIGAYLAMALARRGGLFVTETKFQENSGGSDIAPEPLVRSTIEDGKLRKWDAIATAFHRLQRKTGVNDGRGFYCLRKTGASMIEQIDP